MLAFCIIKEKKTGLTSESWVYSSETYKLLTNKYDNRNDMPKLSKGPFHQTLIGG